MLALVLIMVLLSFTVSFIVSFEIIKKLSNKWIFFIISGVIIGIAIASFITFFIAMVKLDPDLFVSSLLLYFILTIISGLIILMMIIFKIKIEPRYIYDTLLTTLAPIIIILYIVLTDYIVIINENISINMNSSVSIIGLTLPIIVLTSLATLLISISSQYIFRKNDGNVYDEIRVNSTYFDSKNIFIILIGAIIGVFVLADIDFTAFPNENLQERYKFILDMYKFIFSAALIPIIFTIHKKNKTSDN